MMKVTLTLEVPSGMDLFIHHGYRLWIHKVDSKIPFNEAFPRVGIKT